MSETALVVAHCDVLNLSTRDEQTTIAHEQSNDIGNECTGPDEPNEVGDNVSFSRKAFDLFVNAFRHVASSLADMRIQILPAEPNRIEDAQDDPASEMSEIRLSIDVERFAQ